MVPWFNFDHTHTFVFSSASRLRRFFPPHCGARRALPAPTARATSGRHAQVASDPSGLCGHASSASGGGGGLGWGVVGGRRLGRGRGVFRGGGGVFFLGVFGASRVGDNQRHLVVITGGGGVSRSSTQCAESWDMLPPTVQRVSKALLHSGTLFSAGFCSWSGSLILLFSAMSFKTCEAVRSSFLTQVATGHVCFASLTSRQATVRALVLPPFRGWQAFRE